MFNPWQPSLTLHSQHIHTQVTKNIVVIKQDKNTVIKHSENNPNLDHILGERSIDPRQRSPTWAA